MASCECGREWTGMSEAHCAATELEALSMRLCDAKMTSQLDSVALERSPDNGGVGTREAPNSLSAVPLPVEADERLRVVGAMLPSMFRGRDNLKVGWGVIGLDVVDVVHVIIGANDSRSDSMFVCFNVRKRPGSPPQPDVSVGTAVPTWLEVGWRLSRRKGAYMRFVPGFQATGAVPLLRGSGNLGGACDAWLRNSDHAVIVLQWWCHESFSTVANFDAHRVFRVDGDWNTRGCLNSAEIDSLRSKSGRKLFDRSPRKAGYVWVGAGSNPHGEREGNEDGQS